VRNAYEIAAGNPEGNKIFGKLVIDGRYYSGSSWLN
jgi:hypothetical protein